MTTYYNRRDQKAKRRELRDAMPPAEVLLWSKLKNRQLNSHRFRRQHSIGPYVLDFYCPRLKLAVELDGESHYLEGAMSRDDRRDAFIAGFAIRIVRILNSEVYENLDVVWDGLLRETERRVVESDGGMLNGGRVDLRHP
ncbi:MAG: endonuclease domain-containing protein [Planctomycetes bacterium]|nr:endonuclease domain-containing protein [Planctomycetota bacterium]